MATPSPLRIPLLAIPLLFGGLARAADPTPADGPIEAQKTAAQKAEAKKADKPSASIGGVMFASYGYDLTEGAEGENGFELDRLYVDGRAKLDDRWSFRFTLDAGRPKAQSVAVPDGAGGEAQVTVPEDTKVRVFVKYAYAEYKTPLDGIKVRAGMAGLPLINYYDGLWGHRFASKAFTDELKILDSSDLGVHLLGTHARELVDWQLAAINGEGYSNPESDGAKSVQARVSIDPLRAGEAGSLPITGFVSYGAVKDGDPMIVYVGALAYDQEYLMVWAEYVGQVQGDARAMGISGTLVGKVPDVLNAFGRVDRYDPSTEGADDATLRIVGGLSRELGSAVMLAAQYERTTAEATPDLPMHGVFLRMQAKY